MAERHYSLAERGNRNFLERVTQSELERTARHPFETDRHGSVEAAIDAVDRTVGWDRMFDVRESHNDMTFLDEFLTGGADLPDGDAEDIRATEVEYDTKPDEWP